jgi:hypothetical protein
MSLPISIDRKEKHMRATAYHGPRDMRIDQVPDPIIAAPTDVIARITHTGICGSDLWSYRGIDHRAPGERMYEVGEHRFGPFFPSCSLMCWPDGSIRLRCSISPSISMASHRATLRWISAKP